MSSPTRSLARQTIVYGTGTILARLVTFLLLPVLTNALTPQEYGTVTLVYVFLGFLNVVYHYGLDAALMKELSSEEAQERRRVIFSTAVWMAIGTSLALSLIVASAATPIASVFLGDPTSFPLIRLAAVILLLDTVALVPAAFLRFLEKPLRFLAVKLANVITTLALSLYWVTWGDLGVRGAFMSVLAASAVSAVLAFALTATHLRPALEFAAIPRILRFGLPFIPTGISVMVLEMIDRVLLQRFLGAAEVGLYSAGYKLAIFMLLVTSAFQYAWQPFFLKRGKSPESAALFGRIVTLLLAAMGSVWVLVTISLNDLLGIRIAGHTIVGENFVGIASIVPIVLAAYVFQGLHLCLIPGLYFERKTLRLPLITAVGAAVNIVVNLLLIPPLGRIGAALATLAGYAAMAATAYAVSRHLFPIPLDWAKFAVILLAATASLVPTWIFGGDAPARYAGLLIYPAVLLAFRAITPQFARQMIFQLRRASAGNPQ